MTVRFALIGAGSAHAPRIVEALAREAPEQDRLEVVCIDPASERLDVNLAYTTALLERSELGPVSLRPRSAFTAEDAHVDVVVSLFRVGGLPTRCQDEARARRHGLLAQETHGWAGFASALRNVPVAAGISSLLRAEGSDAWHVLVSNPVGILTSAAARSRPERTVGVCDMPFKLVGAAARALAIPPQQLDVDYVGLNHCGWITRAHASGGEDVLPRLLSEPVLSAILAEAGGPNIPAVGDVARVCRELGALPTPYLRYLYARAEMVQRSASSTLRAEECVAIDREVFAAHRALDVDRARSAMSLRGGVGIAKVVATAAWERLRPAGRSTVSCALLRSPLTCVHERAAVELIGAPPAPGSLHPQMQALLSQVAAYEVMTADAACAGDFDAAVLAAASNPWIGTADLAEAMLQEMLAEQRTLLPSFA